MLSCRVRSHEVAALRPHPVGLINRIAGASRFGELCGGQGRHRRLGPDSGLEGAQHAVTSNVIAPGAISTPLLASLNSSAQERLASRIPMGRPGDARSSFLLADLRSTTCHFLLDKPVEMFLQ